MPLSYGVAGRGRGLIEAWNPLDNLWGQHRHLRVRKKQLERYGEPVEEANTIEYEDTMVTPLAGEHEIAALTCLYVAGRAHLGAWYDGW